MKRKLTKVACAFALAVAGGAAQAATILYSEGAEIPINAGSGPVVGLDLDINKDGTTDITLRENAGRGFSYVGAYGRAGARLGFGDAFQSGDLIGPGLGTAGAVALTGNYDFQFRGRRVADTFGAWDNDTTDQRIGYLGFRLGTGQYGWLQLALNPLGTDLDAASQVLAFGFETEVGIGIEAGAETEVIPNPLPASAWLIGVGVFGLGAVGRMKKRKS